MNPAGGYDYVFVEALSEDFTCVFCHLALKNPLQVEDCGHIFCKGCFDQMKHNTETNSEDLCCPLDREKIDPTHVFKNKATERKVLSLIVKCPNFGDECEWSGELREIQEHEANCRKTKPEMGVIASVKELKQLVNRINDLENKAKSHDQKLEEKDQQIKNQNNHIRNLNEQIKKQSKEIKNLNQLDENKSNLTTINTAFQWKFNVDQVKSGMQPYSPLFYNTDGNCFQFGANFKNNGFEIIWYRCRGKHDFATSGITTKRFNYDIYVMGKNGKSKEIHNDGCTDEYRINSFNDRSNGFFHLIKSDEIDEYAINGYIHINCTMK